MPRQRLKTLNIIKHNIILGLPSKGFKLLDHIIDSICLSWTSNGAAEVIVSQQDCHKNPESFNIVVQDQVVVFFYSITKKKKKTFYNRSYNFTSSSPVLVLGLKLGTIYPPLMSWQYQSLPQKYLQSQLKSPQRSKLGPKVRWWIADQSSIIMVCDIELNLKSSQALTCIHYHLIERMVLHSSWVTECAAVMRKFGLV